MLKVTFLGTGTSQGVPVIACQCAVCQSTNTKDLRLRSSILVETKETSIVVDTGPDFRQQMLNNKVQQLDAVVFTHEHKDHISGLDDIRAFNFLQKRPMDVYASERVQKALKREYHYIFERNPYPGIPKINLHTMESAAFQIADLSIQPLELMHYKLPVYGFKFNNAFTYITDANDISDDVKARIRNSKVLVLNALRKEPHISHFTLQEAIDLVEELAPEKAYFTHISHLMGKHEDVNRELPKNIEIAFDGLSVTI